MNLLYRASRDRVEFKNVEKRIKNKGNLIFFYLTGKERIFGNYISVELKDLVDQQDKYYNGENAFVFILNNNWIYKIFNLKLAIRFFKQKYPIIVGNNSSFKGLYFEGNTIYDKNLLNEPKVYDFGKDNELTRR